MKLYSLKIIALIMLATIFTGCERIDNFIGKAGQQCDDQGVVSLSETILNNQIIKNGNLKIDLKNIVVWDYNKVGRYSCKAKVTGTITKDTKDSWMLSLYGLKVDNKTKQVTGWIKYSTYLTTKNNYYVAIERITK